MRQRKSLTVEQSVHVFHVISLSHSHMVFVHISFKVWWLYVWRKSAASGDTAGTCFRTERFVLSSTSQWAQFLCSNIFSETRGQTAATEPSECNCGSWTAHIIIFTVQRQWFRSFLLLKGEFRLKLIYSCECDHQCFYTLCWCSTNTQFINCTDVSCSWRSLNTLTVCDWSHWSHF